MDLTGFDVAEIDRLLVLPTDEHQELQEQSTAATHARLQRLRQFQAVLGGNLSRVFFTQFRRTAPCEFDNVDGDMTASVSPALEGPAVTS